MGSTQPVKSHPQPQDRDYSGCPCRSWNGIVEYRCEAWGVPCETMEKGWFFYSSSRVELLKERVTGNRSISWQHLFSSGLSQPFELFCFEPPLVYQHSTALAAWSEGGIGLPGPTSSPPGCGDAPRYRLRGDWAVGQSRILFGLIPCLGMGGKCMEWEDCRYPELYF